MRFLHILDCPSCSRFSLCFQVIVLGSFDLCLNNACMHDVHMTSPHDSSRPRSRPGPPTRHNHKGLALWWLITLDESSPQWVPARTPTVFWGPYAGRPWVAQTALQRSKLHAMTHHSIKTKDRSSDKHGSGAALPPTGVTTKQMEQKTDRNVNTELSAVVNHIAKLNDSGVDKETTDRERRVVEIAKQKVDHSV